MKLKIYIQVIVFVLMFTVSSAESVQVNLTPGITVGGTYTDNLFLTEVDAKSEFITTIAPSVRLGLVGKLSGIDLFYEPSYAFYNEYDESNTWRHQVDFLGWLQVTKNARLDLRDNFINTEDPLSGADIARLRTEDPTVPIDPTVRRGRNRYTRNFASINYNHQFGLNDAFRIGYRHRFLENEDLAIEDSSASEPYAGFTFWFSPKWGFDSDVLYTMGDYDFTGDIDRFFGTIRLLRKFTRNLDGYIRYSHSIVEFDTVAAAAEDTTYNPSIGINYLIEEDITLIAEIGYYINEFDLREDQSGITSDVRLIKRFRRGSINLSFLCGYDYQLFVTTQQNGFEKFIESAVSGTYSFTRYLSGNITGAYRYSDFVDVGYENDRYQGRVGLTWTPLNWMAIDATYSYAVLESTALQDYDENRIFLRVSLVPSIPYRF